MKERTLDLNWSDRNYTYKETDFIFHCSSYHEIFVFNTHGKSIGRFTNIKPKQK